MSTDKVAAPCVDGQCRGHNERLNIWRAGQHFVRQLLPLRAPSALEPQIQLLLEAYSDSSWSTERILSATDRLLNSYSADHAHSSKYPLEVSRLGRDDLPVVRQEGGG